MKPTQWFKTAVLSSSVILGASSLALAQDRRDEAKPPQGEMRQEEPKPAQDEMKPRQDEVKPQDQNADKPGSGENNSAKHAEAKANNQAGGKAQRGGHIPDDKFRAHFGRQHAFVVNHPTVVEGQPRFRYSGYWFTIVDVWPVEWAYSDQVYVDFINGEYFLFDVLHPGVQVSLFVVE